MQRLIITFPLLLLCITVNAQTFANKLVIDMSDNVILSDNIESVVIHDVEKGMITIEENGRQPQVFRIIRWCDYSSSGDEENIVNLVDNIYGYQNTWCAVKESDYDAYARILESIELEEIPRAEGLNEMLKLWYFIIHRVVHSPSTHSYQTELWWIQDENNGLKTIYAE